MRYSYSVIIYIKADILSVRRGANLYGTAVFPWQHAVFDGVFHQRLQDQAGKVEIQVIRQVVSHFKALPETGHFNVNISLDMPDLLAEIDEYAFVVQAVPVIFSQIDDQVFGFFRVAPAVVTDGVQRVKKKVGIDLCLQYLNFRFRKQDGLLFQLVDINLDLQQAAETAEQLHFEIGKIFFGIFADDKQLLVFRLLVNGKDSGIITAEDVFLNVTSKVIVFPFNIFPGNFRLNALGAGKGDDPPLG